MSEEKTKAYRYEKYCNDETLRDWDNNSNVRVRLKEFTVLKETPKGYWIDTGNKSKKWVGKDSKSPFAVLSIEQALENFVLRQQRSIRIMQHQIEFAKLGIACAKQHQEKVKKEKEHNELFKELEYYKYLPE